MKKKAFTCVTCGALNIPLVNDRWQGFNPCLECGSMEMVTAAGEIRTAPHLYHEFSRLYGLPVSVILELQKRGLLPRDLAACTSVHRNAAGAVKLAIASEEILRAALASLPKSRRESLIHPIVSDGFLTKWQRHVLNHYLVQYQFEEDHNPPLPLEKGKAYGSAVTPLSDMILFLEERFGLPASTTRSWILRLKKRAYNRIRRGTKGGGHE